MLFDLTLNALQWNWNNKFQNLGTLKKNVNIENLFLRPKKEKSLAFMLENSYWIFWKALKNT